MVIFRKFFRKVLIIFRSSKKHANLGVRGAVHPKLYKDPHN